MENSVKDSCIELAQETVDTILTQNPDMKAEDIILNLSFTAAALTIFMRQYNLQDVFQVWVKQ